MRKNHVFLSIFAISVWHLGFALCDAAPFERIVIFGDSLSDTGNVFASSGGAFPPSDSNPPGVLYSDGRFTNGQVWVEYLAEAIDVPVPGPSLLGGSNFAWGGAKSGVSFEPYVSTLPIEPFPLTSTVSIQDQVGSFLSAIVVDGAEVPDPDTTLYVVWGGANDFLLGGENPSVVVENIQNSINDLIKIVGAKHLLVPNMPPLTDTPGVGNGFPSLGVSTQLPSKLSKLVNKFNSKLGKKLKKIATKNKKSNVSVYALDVFSLLEEVIDNPVSNGFNPFTGIPSLNESVLYGSSGLLFLNDPSSAVFWDSVHPTTGVHAVIAIEAALLIGQ